MGVNVGWFFLFWLVGGFFHVLGRREEISNSSCVPSLSGTAEVSFQIQVSLSVFAKAGCTPSCKA